MKPMKHETPPLCVAAYGEEEIIARMTDRDEICCYSAARSLKVLWARIPSVFSFSVSSTPGDGQYQVDLARQGEWGLHIRATVIRPPGEPLTYHLGREASMWLWAFVKTGHNRVWVTMWDHF